MKLLNIIITAFLIFFIFGGGIMAQSVFFSEKDLTDNMIEETANYKIYFGHKSVGYNILDGLSLLAPEVRIVESSTGGNDEPCFAHSGIGENGDAISKIDDFVKIVSESYGGKSDFVFMKLCFIDIGPETDVESLFNYYKKAMASLKSKFPETVIVHFTVPLTEVKRGPKAFLKKLLGKPVRGFEDNIKKEEYNNLVRKEFSGKEPVFDFALIESTLPDGERSVHDYKGKEYYSLAPLYSDDGGHLNEQGRMVAAVNLIRFLSEIK